MDILNKKELLEKQLAEITGQQSKPKAIEHPKQIGISYNPELQRMILAVKKDIDTMLKPQIKTLAPEYTADSAIQAQDGWFELIAKTLLALRAKWSSARFDAYADKIAGNFVRGVDLNNATKSANNYQGFGINVLNDK